MRSTATRGALIAAVSALCPTVAAEDPPQPVDDQPTLRQVLDEVRALRKRVAELESRREEPPPPEPAARPRPEPQPHPSLPEPAMPPDASNMMLALPPETMGGQGNLFNPAITVFGDMGYWFSTNKNSPLANRFNIREFEIDLQAAISSFANGVLVLAVGEEPVVDAGEVSIEFNFEIEEGYIDLHTLPLDLSARGGKFRNRFGINNQLHTHDLPQVTRPAAVVAFLGPEGLSTIGASVNWLVPNPWDKYVEVTGNLFNATDVGESPIFEGAGAENPGVLGHVKYSDDFGSDGFYELGGSYIYAPSAMSASDVNIFGLDAMLKWVNPEAPDSCSLLFQTEFFWASNPVVDSPFGMFSSRGFGFYTFGQVQFARDWYAGVRFDYTEFPGAQLRGPGDSDWDIAADLTWYVTEFLRLRLEYQHVESAIAGSAMPEDNVLFQMTFVFGAHPPHPYWVSR